VIDDHGGAEGAPARRERCVHRRVVGEGDVNAIRAAHGVFGRVDHPHAERSEPLGLASGPVPSADLVAAASGGLREAGADETRSQKCELRHGAGDSPPGLYA
jgi:hypothetical protein